MNPLDTPSNNQADDLPARIKEMIVRVLLLEGVTAEDIRTDGPLFGAGLGLDSVDALELAIHVEEEFGVKMPDDERTRGAFASVGALAAFITKHAA